MWQVNLWGGRQTGGSRGPSLALSEMLSTAALLSDHTCRTTLRVMRRADSLFSAGKRRSDHVSREQAAALRPLALKMHIYISG